MTTRSRVVVACLGVVVVLGYSTLVPLAQTPGPPHGGDWPQWRGPGRDGVVALEVPAKWPQRLTKRWQIAVGSGHASPVISGSRVIVHARQGEREVTRALDIESGKELWRHDYAAPYTMNSAARGHGPGPKSTPAVASGRVFTFGISGILSALDVSTGKLLWRVEAPAAPPDFGTATSPIVDGALVITHVGGIKGGALTAFDAATGARRWQWTGDGPGYASPVIAVIDGTRHLITQTQKFIVGLDAASGARLWQLPFTTSYDQNSVTPVVVGDLLIYSGLDSGTSAVRLVRKSAVWTTVPVWKNEQVSMYMSSPVIANGRLYGLSHRNSGQFFAIDLGSGKTVWTTPGREGENASIMTAGALLLLTTTNAELIVARAGDTRLEEVARYTVADSAVWAHPAVSGRRVIVKDAESLVCWTL